MCTAVVLAAGCGTRAFLHMERKELGDGVVFFEGGGGNSTVLMHGREAFVVDAKIADFALRLQRGIEEPKGRVGREATRIMLTHAHADHTAGLRRFSNLGAVVVHVKCKKRLLDEDDAWLRTQPYVEVEEAINLDVGADTVHIFHPGTAHTDGDLAAFLPKRRLLIAGDLWNNGYEPEADPRYGGDLRGLLRAYDRMLLLPFEEVLPGHGPKGTRAQLQHSRDYLKAMEDAVRGAVAQGLDEDGTAEQVTLKDWAPFTPIPIMASRELNVRMMWRSLHAEAQRGGP